MRRQVARRKSASKSAHREYFLQHTPLYLNDLIMSFWSAFVSFRGRQFSSICRAMTAFTLLWPNNYAVVVGDCVRYRLRDRLFRGGEGWGIGKSWCSPMSPRESYLGAKKGLLNVLSNSSKVVWLFQAEHVSILANMKNRMHCDAPSILKRNKIPRGLLFQRCSVCSCREVDHHGPFASFAFGCACHRLVG